MKVFWSWQSDRDPKLHHYFVRDALKDACKLIAIDADYDEAERPEVDYDTKNVAGTPDITKTILDKIAAANVFVADMTPVGTTDPVALQPNTPPEKRSEPKFCLHERDRLNERLFSISVAVGSAKREEGSIRPGLVDRPGDHRVGE
jgi:hypothetical protein